MKITINTIKYTLLALALCFSLASPARAVPVDLTTASPLFLGDIQPGVPNSPQDRLDYTNHLISLAAPTTGDVFDSHTYDRSSNIFASLPTAAGADMGGNGTADLTLSMNYTYLLQKYDGNNGGYLVWDISSLAAGTEITVPDMAFGFTPNAYSLYNPGAGNPSSTPEGGMTMVLMGMALAGLGLFRRFFLA